MPARLIASIQLCLYLVILCFPVLHIQAQENFTVKRWNSDNGLSVEKITSILEDKKGFMWIGTEQGLFRFDGSYFKIYLPSEKKNKSILDGSIYGIVEDSLENLWVGSSQGLSRYDYKADSFTHFLPSAVNDSLNNFIIPFWSTADEVYCVESFQRISSINIHSHIKKVRVEHLQIERPQTDKLMRTLFSRKENEFWILDEKGLLNVSLQTGAQKKYPFPGMDAQNLPPSDFPNILYDSKEDLIWITSTHGLFRFSLRTRQYEWVQAVSDFMKRKDFGAYPGLDIDGKGRIWLDILDAGLIIYDPRNNSIEPVFKTKPLQASVSENTGIIYHDSRGIVWLGKFESGLDQLMPFQPIAERLPMDPGSGSGLRHTRLNCLAAGPNGKIWVGTDDGLVILDPVTNKKLFLNGKELGIPGPSFIQDMTIDTAAHKAWLAAVSGVFQMDIPSGKCQLIGFFTLEGKPLQKKIFWDSRMVPVESGIVFNLRPEGIFYLNPDSTHAHQLRTLSTKHIITKMTSGKSNQIFLRFFGSRINMSLVLRENRLDLSNSPMDTIPWSAIYYHAPTQEYWVSSNWQLYRFDKNFQLLTKYGDREGESGSQFFSVVGDNKGNIWCNSQTSISKLDTSTGQFFSLSEKDGYLKEKFEWGRKPIKDAQGNIYFLGGSDLVVVRPKNLVDSYPSSQVYIKSISVNQHVYSGFTNANEISQLDLNHSQNRLSVETGTLDYFSMGYSTIRYKLEGVNSSWQYVPAGTSIRYERLSPDNYTLSIQASNALQQWNGPLKTIRIQIHPPFWQTGWFIAAAFVAFLILLYVLYEWRTRILRKQKTNLEQTVTLRTNELRLEKLQVEESLEKLKNAQNQLVHAEKMASLGELTAGIAHEIQNPLNFVNNFSEVNTELIQETELEIEKGNYDEARTLLNDIRENEKKIIHHGKRADSIVKGMLQHSRPNAGQKELTDINALAEEYLRISFHGMCAKDKLFNATLKTDFDKSIGKVKIVPEEMGRVFLNLYNNAFYAVNEKRKASPDAYEPLVKVISKRTNGKIEWRVNDNGYGIPSQNIEKIFQPFFTTKPTGQGTGLGLSLSYDIITKGHGGELSVETEEGAGTSFIIRLPDSSSRSGDTLD